MFFDLVIPLLGIYPKDTFRRRTFINTHFFYVAKHCYNFPTIESRACWTVVSLAMGMQEQRHKSVKQPDI